MNSFSACLGFGPLAIYLVFLGAINLSRRPFLVSGTRDTAVLGLALSGLMIVGPIQLFFPIEASIRYGVYVWAFLITMYGLVVVLVLLMLRPRLVIYNISMDELRPILAGVVTQLDSEARWAGDSLALPNLRVQLHLDCMPVMRNVSLASTGPVQSHIGWRRLESALSAALAPLVVRRNPSVAAYSLLTAGASMAIILISNVAHDPQAIAQGLLEMFR